jgi:hypothetical protein
MKKLPQALKPLMEQDRWVIWEYTADGKKPPYQSRNPTKHASTTDPKTWSSYAGAVAAAPEDGGVGFVIGGGIGALDLDDCRDPDTGALTDWAQALIDKANGAYVEVTPSKRGLRIIGTADGGTIHTVRQMGVGKVEVYRDTPRYITVSGDQRGKCGKVGSIDDLIDVAAAADRKDTTGSGLFMSEVCKRGEKGWDAERIEADIRQKPSQWKHTSAARYDREKRLLQEIERCLKNAGIENKESYKARIARLADERFRPLSEVTSRKVEWLLPGFIPFNLPTMCDGYPDIGKSYFGIHVAAEGSRGVQSTEPRSRNFAR